MVFEILKDRILKDGKCFDGGVLKVDRFINHQMDPYLMKQISIEFIRRFADLKVNKIVTVEASGIAPAVMLGYQMELPVVFAKKQQPSTMSDMYVAEATSFTKKCDYKMVISKEFLTKEDRVLFIDDFLAYGSTGLGAIELCRQAGASIEGMGFIIEKAFQKGRHLLEEAGVKRIESLAVIDSLENGQIEFR